MEKMSYSMTPSSIRKKALVGLFSTISDLVHSKEIEECYLDQCWLECPEKGICLPTHWLYLEDQENPNKVRRIATDFLSESGEANVLNTCI